MKVLIYQKIIYLIVARVNQKHHQVIFGSINIDLGYIWGFGEELTESFIKEHTNKEIIDYIEGKVKE